MIGLKVIANLPIYRKYAKIFNKWGLKSQTACAKIIIIQADGATKYEKQIEH